MTKAELKKIMSDNCIFEPDIEDAINFVNDLLEFQVKELEENEPYATTTINQLRHCAYEVWNLHDYIEDIREKEEV